MPLEPALSWRREIGGQATLPVAWLLDIGPSVADPAVRLAVATRAIRAAVECDRLEVRRSANGAPIVSDATLRVSTASRDGCLAIALAREAVGVDVEAVAPLDPLPLSVLHPDERAFVGDGPIDRFFWLWTAKEAYWKFVSLGFGHGDETVAVVPQGNRVLVRPRRDASFMLRRETATLASGRGTFFATSVFASAP